MQRDGSNLFSNQENVYTVRLKKFSLQKYGSKTKVFLDTRRKNLFFRQNELLNDVPHKERKNMEKKLQKFGINMGQRYKIFRETEKY